jgi:hypothetical protein
MQTLWSQIASYLGGEEMITRAMIEGGEEMITRAMERIQNLVPGIEIMMPNNDVYELIADKLEEQKSKLEHANEALNIAVKSLELFTKTVDHRGVVASYPMQYVTKAHQDLTEIRRWRGGG